MRRKIAVAFTIAALLGTVPLLSACNTTAGAGQDLSATGHAITGAADKNKP